MSSLPFSRRTLRHYQVCYELGRCCRLAYSRPSTRPMFTTVQPRYNSQSPPKARRSFAKISAYEKHKASTPNKGSFLLMVPQKSARHTIQNTSFCLSLLDLAACSAGLGWWLGAVEPHTSLLCRMICVLHFRSPRVVTVPCHGRLNTEASWRT